MPTKPRILSHPRPTKRPPDDRPSAAARGYGHGWRQARLAWLREHPLCVDCLAVGRTEPATDVDHVVALAKGGADDESNYRSLCHRHHSIKTQREDRGR